jgi:hypothetical protein
MKLKDKDLEQFITIYEQSTGITITKQEALPKALALLTLVKLTYKPIPKNYYEKPKQQS